MHCWKWNPKMRSDLVTYSGTPDCDCAELECLHRFLCEWDLLETDKSVETKLKRRKLAVDSTYWAGILSEWRTDARITELSRRERLGPWLYQYHPPPSHLGPPPTHPLPFGPIAAFELRSWPMALVELHCTYAVSNLQHLELVLMIWLSDSAQLTHLVIRGFLADPGYCHQTCSALHGCDCAPALLYPLAPILPSLVKSPLAPWNKCHYLSIWKEYTERENTFYPNFSCILLICWSECCK